MEFARIAGATFAAAIGYGILHNQITVRLSAEYFTLGHPAIFPFSSPAVVALAWGLLATSWLGTPLGFLLAVICRNGSHPTLGLSDVARPLGLLLLATACLALPAGIAGFAAGESGQLELAGRLAAIVPEETQSRYLAARFAHGASYVGGLLGSFFLLLATWRRRRDRAR